MRNILPLAALALLGCGGSQFDVSTDAGAATQRDPKPDNVLNAPEAGSRAVMSLIDATTPTERDASSEAEAASIADPPDAGVAAALDAGAPDADANAICSCPTGCCDRDGSCHTVTSNAACGAVGAWCVDCTSNPRGGVCGGSRCVEYDAAGLPCTPALCEDEIGCLMYANDAGSLFAGPTCCLPAGSAQECGCFDGTGCSAALATPYPL